MAGRGRGRDKKRAQQLAARNPQNPSSLQSDSPQAEGGDSHTLLSLEQRSSIHVGPLPPPEVLSEYDRIAPGAAAIIINMADQQSKHRRELERQMMERTTNRERVGQHYGFWLTLLIAAGGVYLAAVGKVGGYVVLVGELVALAGVFIVGKKLSIKELLAKRKKSDT